MTDRAFHIVGRAALILVLALLLASAAHQALRIHREGWPGATTRLETVARMEGLR